MRAFRSVPFGLLVPSALLAASGCADLPEASTGSGPALYSPQVAPSALILSPEVGAAVTSGDALRLVGRVSDADGAAGELAATFLLDGTAVCEDITPDADGMVECDATAMAGEGELELHVVDGDGLSGSHTIGLSIEAGPAPTLVLDDRDVQKSYSDVAIEFTGAMAGSGPLELSFTSHQDGSEPFEIEVDADGRFSASAYLSPGDHVITVTVTDGEGNSTHIGSSLFVDGPNTIPNCVVLSPDGDDNTTTGEATTLSGQVDDADIGPSGLRVMWSSDADGYLGEGELDPTTGMVALDATLSAGTHALTLTAVDEVGATCRDTIEHIVGEAPSIEVAGPAGMVDEGDVVEFTAEVEGAALMTAGLLVRWSVGGEVLGLSTLDTSGITTFATDALPVGASTVAVDLMDADGWAAVGSYDVLVNGRPIAPSVSGGGAVSSSDDLVVVRTADGKDPEDMPLVERYQWYVNGSPTSVSTTLSFPAAATQRGDEVSLHVYVNDGRIDSAPAIVDFQVGNSAPANTAVVMSPAVPSSSDGVLCIATATDGDGNALTQKYSWWSDGREVAQGDTLAPGMVPGGKALECRVEFIDGYDRVAASSGATVVGHSAPTLSALSFRQGAPTTDTTLEAGFIVNDFDMDEVEVEYSWTVNGAPAGNAAALSGELWFEAGDTVALTVTPVDAFHRGASSSVSVVIADSPVEPPQVGFSDDRIREGEDLVCIIATPGFDPDGDAVTHSIEWYHNDVAWTGAVYDGEELGDTIDGADVMEGDTWACVVTASTATDADSAYQAIEISAPPPESVHTLRIEDLMGATDTCDGTEAVADGDLYADVVDLTYIAVPLPAPLNDGEPVSAIAISVEAAACDAAEGAIGTFIWSVTNEDFSSTLAEGSAPLAAPTGCSCPDTGEVLELGAPLDGSIVAGEHQLLFAIDAATFGLIEDGSENVVTITYTY